MKKTTKPINNLVPPHLALVMALIFVPSALWLILILLNPSPASPYLFMLLFIPIGLLIAGSITSVIIIARNIVMHRRGTRPLSVVQRRLAYLWLAVFVLVVGIMAVFSIAQARQSYQARQFLGRDEVIRLVKTCQLESFHKTNSNTPYGNEVVVQVVYKDRQLAWYSPTVRKYTQVYNFDVMIQARSDAEQRCGQIRYDDLTTKVYR